MRETPSHEPRVILDRTTPVPLYHQISSALKDAVASGELAPGTRIENELAMAARLGVSRPTARRALQDLVDDGLLVRRRGVGTQVAAEPIRRPMEPSSLYDDLATAGREPSTEVLEYRATSASADEAEQLRITEGTEIVHVKRLRYADAEPLAIMMNLLPAVIAPSRAALESEGLYQALRTNGIQVRMAHQTIRARLATASEARILQERPRSALLTMERLAIDSSDTVVEYGSHVYRASRYSFDTTLLAR